MLKETGANLIIMPPNVDETVPANTAPHITVMFLALKKALSVENQATVMGYSNGEILIAADTLVIYKNEIIGKPENKNETIRILKKLRDEEHKVLTGVAIFKLGTNLRKLLYETSIVKFKDYTDDEIINYADTSEPYDKAGAYAVQGTWGKYIEKIVGDTDNVIGLPLGRLKRELSL